MRQIKREDKSIFKVKEEKEKKEEKQGEGRRERALTREQMPYFTPVKIRAMSPHRLQNVHCLSAPEDPELLKLDRCPSEKNSQGQ